MERISKTAFVFSLCLLSVAYGMAIISWEIFPYRLLRSAYLTLSEARKVVQSGDVGEFLSFNPTARANAPTGRVIVIEDGTGEEGPGEDGTGEDGTGEDGTGEDGTYLFFGGRHQFLERCPDSGCLAVVMSGSGEILRSVPYLPEAIFAANRIHDLPYETRDFDFAHHSYPVGIEPYPDGDLLVVFQSNHIFPFGAGVARVRPDGSPAWFRWDYGHHWPTLNADGSALVLSTRIGTEAVVVPLPDGNDIRLPCPSGRPYRDLVNVLSPDGRTLREVAVLDALLASPFRAVLQHSTDGCDPVHLNYAFAATAELAQAVDGVEPGDLVLSLRNISSIGVVDGRDGRFKQLLRGSFFQQHSVQHLDGSRLIMFDNQGGDGQAGPSRVLTVDLAGGREETVFPTSETPAAYGDFYSHTAGHLELSSDRRRAIVAVSATGTALEISIADGRLLRVFRSLHDVAAVRDLPPERERVAAAFRLYGVGYMQ